MSHFLLQSRLVLKNSIDQSGFRPFLLRTTVFAWLNLLMIALILHPLPEGGSLWPYLTTLYVYFLPMLALSAAVGSFELELFAGTGEWLLLSPAAVWRSRLLTLASELAIPLLTFAVLFIYTEQPWQVWITAAAMTVVFTWLGLGIGFLWGFRNEKSINNFCNSIIWILGFGPGPFLGTDVKWYQTIFPGAHALTGDYTGEAVKLGIYCLIAVVIQWLARRPRSYRFFAK